MAGMRRLVWTEHNQEVVPSISFMPQLPLQTGEPSSLSGAPLNPSEGHPLTRGRMSFGGKPTIPSSPTEAGITS